MRNMPWKKEASKHWHEFALHNSIAAQRAANNGNVTFTRHSTLRDCVLTSTKHDLAPWLFALCVQPLRHDVRTRVKAVKVLFVEKRIFHQVKCHWILLRMKKKDHVYWRRTLSVFARLTLEIADIMNSLPAWLMNWLNFLPQLQIVRNSISVCLPLDPLCAETAGGLYSEDD